MKIQAQYQPLRSRRLYGKLKNDRGIHHGFKKAD